MDDGWNGMMSLKELLGTTLRHSLGVVVRPPWGPPPKEAAASGGLHEVVGGHWRC